MKMEIERKFRMEKLPEDLDRVPVQRIEQVYLCEDPILRVRRQDDDCFLTCKGAGRLAHREYEIPLSSSAYEELKGRAEGCLIRKRRFLIPLPPYTAELDVFEEPFDDMALAEIEFPTEEAARSFVPPDWFGEDVTADDRFRNNRISRTRYLHHSFYEPAES